MSVTGWVSGACVVVLVLVLAVVSVDRNRLRHRMDNAEGAVTGLTLDLEVTRDLVRQLQTYLGSPSSWDVDATAPPRLVPAAGPDRWSAPDRAEPGRQDPEVAASVLPLTSTERSEPAETDGRQRQ